MNYNFKELIVWQESVNLVEFIYKRVINQFPSEEKYGLSSQISRAAISIVSNIAEGTGRYSRKEFKQFLYNGRGSLYELISQIEIAKKLKYISLETYEESNTRVNKISGLLNGLINSLK